MPCNNVVQFSSAGSGKTTELINEVLQDTTSKILIVTYTRENCSTIENKIKKENGFIPQNVKLLSWANFIMRDCVRPFHSNKCETNIENFVFEMPNNHRYFTGLQRYLTKNNWIYYDYATDFAIQCNINNCVIERLQKNYDKIYIDEVQDLAGYDLDFLELLLKSTITIKMYGDIRQATYRTQNVNKNSGYRGINIKSKFEEWAKATAKKEAIVTIEEKFISHRCCQEICNIADTVFPDLTKTTSKNTQNLPIVKGVWFADKTTINNIIQNYDNEKLKILRYDKNEKVENITGYNYYNFGECKGCTFDNVVIYCKVKPFLEFIKNGTIPEKDITKTKLYIAITRARYNVIFYADNDLTIGLTDCNKWINI